MLSEYQSGRRYKAKPEGRGGGLFHGWHKNKHLTDSHARSANDAMRIRTGTVFSMLLKYPSRYIHVAVGTLDWLPPTSLRYGGWMEVYYAVQHYEIAELTLNGLLGWYYM